MGYEDTFRIPVSDTQAYKQFGNSVVTPVMSEIARIMTPHVHQILRGVEGGPELVRLTLTTYCVVAPASVGATIHCCLRHADIDSSWGKVMDFGDLADHFDGVAAKVLSTVETVGRSSNQHELDGVKALQGLFGRPSDKLTIPPASSVSATTPTNPSQKTAP